MKITIEIDETHPRFAMVHEALTKSLEARCVSYSATKEAAKDWHEFFRLLRVDGANIEAIKHLRSFTGLGLSEAKDIYESFVVIQMRMS